MANQKNPPFNYIRIADLDSDGNPILFDGEGGHFHEGVFYVRWDGIVAQ